jgi:hypothetical protein
MTIERKAANFPKRILDCGGERSATPLFGHVLKTEPRGLSESAVAADALPAQSKTRKVVRVPAEKFQNALLNFLDAATLPPLSLCKIKS